MPPLPKRPAVNDPIEGAKLESLKPKTAAAAPPEPSPTPVVNPPTPAAPAPAPAPATPVVRSPRYRVKARTTVSLNGQLLTLAPDDILSADSYGDAGMKRLLESSIPLERLPG